MPRQERAHCTPYTAYKWYRRRYCGWTSISMLTQPRGIRVWVRVQHRLLGCLCAGEETRLKGRGWAEAQATRGRETRGMSRRSWLAVCTVHTIHYRPGNCLGMRVRLLYCVAFKGLHIKARRSTGHDNGDWTYPVHLQCSCLTVRRRCKHSIGILEARDAASTQLAFMNSSSLIPLDVY